MAKVKVVLDHHVTIEDKAKVPGDTLTVDDTEAQRFVDAGVAHFASADDEKKAQA